MKQLKIKITTRRKCELRLQQRTCTLCNIRYMEKELHVTFKEYNYGILTPVIKRYKLKHISYSKTNISTKERAHTNA